MDIVMLFLGLGLYFLPTIIAAVGQKTVFFLTLFINLLLGWTVVGWFLALALALWPDRFNRMTGRSC